MKPRDNVFQGGGAATTDPRKPDYTNLFAMKGVDWDDPTVAQLSARARRASGRGDDRPGRWRTTIRCSCSRWSTSSRTTCSAC